MHYVNPLLGLAQQKSLKYIHHTKRINHLMKYTSYFF